MSEEEKASLFSCSFFVGCIVSAQFAQDDEWAGQKSVGPHSVHVQTCSDHSFRVSTAPVKHMFWGGEIDNDNLHQNSAQQIQSHPEACKSWDRQ